MALEIVKAVPEETAIGEDLAGRSTAEDTPKVRAATTSAMAPDATADFVRLNRSCVIESSAAFTVMGMPTEGLWVSSPAVNRWLHKVVGRATETFRDPAFRPS
jgi:hypothetical protein